MGLIEKARQRATEAGQRTDAGITLVEILIVMVLTMVIAASVFGAFKTARTESADMPNRGHQWNAMLDVQEQLLRDVGRGSRIEVADVQHLVVYGQYELDPDGGVSGPCIRREYTVDETARTLSVRTTWLGSEKCATTGSEESRTETLLEHYTGTATFEYTAADSRVKTAPVKDLGSIKTVRWDLQTQLPGLTQPQELASAQAWTGRADTHGTGTPDVRADATAPVLELATPVQGYDQPVLRWTDTSPAIPVSGMTIWRTAWTTGGSATGKLRAVAIIPDPKLVTTWTDNSLERGASASYVVAMNIGSSSGPMSNAVVTGLRPGQAAVPSVTGAATSIKVAWGAVTGATSYDLYRDDLLVRTGITATTFTDQSGVSGWTGTGYGHNHKYRLVAVNTWEQRWTMQQRGVDVPLGTAATASYAGRGARALSSASAAAFTAPDAPVLTAAASTAGTNTVTWAATGWTGSGGASAATRDRGWTLEARETDPPTFAPVWAGERARSSATYTHGGRTLGDSTRYRAKSCNSSGCGPSSAAVTVLQVPPAPTGCVATLDDSAPTRTATIVVTPAPMVSAASRYTVSGGTVATGYTLSWSGASTSTTKTVDKLRDATVHTFAATTTNTAGESAGTDCTVKTATVQLSLSAAPSSIGSRAHETRTIVAKATSTNATVRTPTIARASGNAGKDGEATGNMVACVASSTILCTADDSWRADPLVDGLAYTVTGRATDGVNETIKELDVTTTAQTTPAIVVSTRTTRRIAASFSSNGLSAESTITLLGVTDEPGKSATWDPLDEGTNYTVRARSSDGFNVTTATMDTSTPKLPAPAAAVCTATLTDSVAPGKLTISGGDQVKLGTAGTVYTTSATYTLGAGTYVGYARNINSDGNPANDKIGAWDACPARTVQVPPPPTPTPPTCVASATYAGGPGVSMAIVNFCSVAGASSYEAQLMTWSRRWNTPSPWTSYTRGSINTPYDVGTGSGYTISDGIAPTEVQSFQWRVRALGPSGTSNWSTGPVVTVPEP